MTSSASIKEFKKNVISCIVSSDEVIKAMGNEDIHENDEAVYSYVFPYFCIPYTIEEAHSYICMKVNMVGRSSNNDLYGDFELIIWAIVNQDLMKMDGVGGATRADNLADEIEKILYGKRFGVKRLEIVSNTEVDLDAKHRARKLIFETSDINDMLCGDIDGVS